MEEALEILKLIEFEGFEAYIVGGAVRDYLLNNADNISDYDICSNIGCDSIYKLFEVKSSLYHSYKIKYKNKEYDLALFRTEKNILDYRHPKSVELINDYKEDSFRRDFTINALYLDCNKNIFDPQNGKKDLNDKVIKLIGDKSIRFKEDSSRILRCLYFKNKLNFTIEQETYQCLLENVNLVSNISLVVVFEIIKKMFTTGKFKVFINDLYKSGSYKYLKFFDKSIEFCYKKKVENLLFLEFLVLTNVFDNDFIEACSVTKQLKTFIIDCTHLSMVTEKDDFSILQLFVNKLEKCEIVAKINCMVYNRKIGFEELKNRYDSLPIKNVCDLKFKGYDLITNYKLKTVSVIATIVDDIKYHVLLQKIPNEHDKIKEFVENKYKGVFIDE